MLAYGDDGLWSAWSWCIDCGTGGRGSGSNVGRGEVRVRRELLVEAEVEARRWCDLGESRGESQRAMASMWVGWLFRRGDERKKSEGGRSAWGF